ncbi:RHS repeat domain-containing protein [Hydrogenophaga sp. BPS33]|uniref:RHS repeat domain-containing protein n=1 Tax=Hydrogenophaga sp. BPS33 TaxID=2651974 RepID=UPI0013202053|nr:RHS repeat-associated core domain-containing protein [Hydrogenophaga sp. BPS33]QHE86273.1 RHS repeat-associated core domain-containing protein [Hydrogenophaga sp. BPS33]
MRQGVFVPGAQRGAARQAITWGRCGLAHLATAGCSFLLALGPSLLQAQVVEPASQLSSTRVVVYERDPLTGVVTAETTQPDVAPHCVRREFTHDAHGNVTATRERNCASGTASGTAAFDTRVHQTAYAATAQSTAGIYPSSRTNPAGHGQQLEYDNAWGSPTRETDPNGLSTTHTQDSLGRRTRSVWPDGRVTNWRYDYCNAQGTSSGSVPVPSGVAPCAPRAVLRVLEVPTRGEGGPINGAVRATYFDPQGREVQQQTLSFAAGDGAAPGTNRRWATVRTEYDVAGRVQRKSDPFFDGDTPVYTRFTYDALGRTTLQSKPSPYAPGGLQQTAHRYGPRKVISVNARGQQQTREFDEHGRILRVIDALAQQQRYHFSAWAGVHLIRDALGHTTQIHYDQGGHKARMVDPGMGTWTYQHDPLGQLRAQTSPKGQTATLHYDTLGRMVQRTEPDLVSHWHYDTTASGASCATSATSTTSKGQLCEATADNQYRRLRQFDAWGRLVQERTTLDAGTAYVSQLHYDADSRVARQTWPTGLAVDHLYDGPTGALTELRLAPSGQSIWKRQGNDARGQFTQVWYGNGAQTLNTYDSQTGLLQASRAGPSGAPTTLIDQAYDYNPLGHLSKRSDHRHGTEEIFTYDELNRLTRSLLNNTARAQLLRNIAYGYDALGNISSNSEVGTYTYARGPGARPHALLRIDGQAGKLANPTYTYDPNGNVLSVAGTNGPQRSHTWTSFDNPLSFSLSQGEVQVDFLYGPEHQRIREVKRKATEGVASQKTVHVLHPDNEGALYFEREVTQAGPGTGQAENRHYISAEKGAFLLITNASALQASPVATTLTDAEQRYWHKDHLGSIVASTSANMDVIERMAYDPFGKRRHIDGSFDQTGSIDASSTNRGFTGHEHLDELDFIHMNARVYDPDVGRFLSPDPTVPEFTNPQAYNRYAYTINNPLNLVDRNGFAHTSPGSDGGESNSSNGTPSGDGNGPSGGSGDAGGDSIGVGPKPGDKDTLAATGVVGTTVAQLSLRTVPVPGIPKTPPKTPSQADAMGVPPTVAPPAPVQLPTPPSMVDSLRLASPAWGLIHDIATSISWGALTTNQVASDETNPQKISDDAVNNLTRGLRPELDKRQRMVRGHFVSDKGDAQESFNSLPGEMGPNDQKTLPDKSVAGIHTSTTTGLTTVHVNRPPGRQDVKVRHTK